VGSSVVSLIRIDVDAVLHQHGIIHRDLKLENVLTDEEHRTVVVADLGLRSVSMTGRNTGTDRLQVYGSNGRTRNYTHGVARWDIRHLS
jgi:serine/threonine protein kinase